MKITSVSLEQVSPDTNTLLAKNIYDKDGNVILNRDSLLCEPTIKRLRNAGISNIYIYVEESSDKTESEKAPQIESKQDYPSVKIMKTIITKTDDAIPDIVPKIVRKQAIRMITNIFKNPKTVPFKQVVTSVSKIIDEILESEQNIVPVEHLRKYDNYTYEHCVNVCILGITLGKILEYTRDELRIFGIGLLLHDFGKTRIPLEILNKPGKLTDDEFKIIKTHAQEGVTELDKLYKLKSESKLVVLNHHEKISGNGYPQGLKGEQIHNYVKISTIADVYDAITSDRIYNSKRTPDEAVKILLKGAGTDFDNYFLSKFLTIVPVEPKAKIEYELKNEPCINIKELPNEEVTEKKQEWQEKLNEPESEYNSNLKEYDKNLQAIKSKDVEDKIVNLLIGS